MTQYRVLKFSAHNTAFINCRLSIKQDQWKFKCAKSVDRTNY